MSIQPAAIPGVAHEAWPSLPYGDWADTCATLHMWTQIVGKVRMRMTPPQNHWWHVPLYVSARGLTSSLVPCEGTSFEIEFDFNDHQLHVGAASGETQRIPLRSRTVAAFYGELMDVLRSMGIEPAIWTRPQEVVPAIPFERDETHAPTIPTTRTGWGRSFAARTACSGDSTRATRASAAPATSSGEASTWR